MVPHSVWFHTYSVLFPHITAAAVAKVETTYASHEFRFRMLSSSPIDGNGVELGSTEVFEGHMRLLSSKSTPATASATRVASPWAGIPKQSNTGAMVTSGGGGVVVAAVCCCEFVWESGPQAIIFAKRRGIRLFRRGGESKRDYGQLS